MPYLQDPRGFGSVWANEGETYEQAMARQQQATGAQYGLPEGDYGNFYNPVAQASRPRPGIELGNVLESQEQVDQARWNSAANPLLGGAAGPGGNAPPPGYQPPRQLGPPQVTSSHPGSPYGTPGSGGHQTGQPPGYRPPQPLGPPQVTSSSPRYGGHQTAPPPNYSRGGNPYTAIPAGAPAAGATNVPGPYAPLPPYGGPQIQEGTDSQYGTINQYDDEGNLLGPPGIPGINLAAPDEVSAHLPESFRQQYIDQMNQIAGSASGQWDYAMPNAQAAQMDTSGVPMPGAASFNISPELQRMLSGEGFDARTMAALRSRATEDVSGAGRMELGQTRRALAAAGLQDSPAGAAIGGDVARRTGQQQHSALRDIDIQNAMLGQENARFGLGHQTQIGLSNMQAANQMALQNANRLFSAMSQNLQNQQSANDQQFGAETSRLHNRAATGSGIIGQQGGYLQQAAANRGGQADFFNASNRMNQGLNQAQLDRQRAIANQQAQEGRWQTGTSIMAGFAPNPANYQVPGFSPTAASTIGNWLSNIGASELDRRQP